MGIAAAQGVSWSVGCVDSVVLLRRRIGRLGGREILGLIGKAGVGSAAALIVAELAHVFLGSQAHHSFVLSALVLILQGVLGGAAFLLFATVLRVPEVNQVVGLLRRKLGR
jgi:putative peptidoglycan lipid II flippase